ncbi:MAG: 50S ribosomal protein L29 [Thermoplasmata archaeon]
MVSPMNIRAIREMSPEERRNKLKEMRDELMHQRGLAAMGGAPPSPGKIRALRTAIARLLTVMKEKGERAS